MFLSRKVCKSFWTVKKIGRIKGPSPRPYKTLHFPMHKAQYDLIIHNFCLPETEIFFLILQFPFRHQNK